MEVINLIVLQREEPHIIRLTAPSHKHAATTQSIRAGRRRLNGRLSGRSQIRADMMSAAQRVNLAKTDTAKATDDTASASGRTKALQLVPVC